MEYVLTMRMLTHTCGHLELVSLIFDAMMEGLFVIYIIMRPLSLGAATFLREME